MAANLYLSTISLVAILTFLGINNAHCSLSSVVAPSAIQTIGSLASVNNYNKPIYYTNLRHHQEIKGSQIDGGQIKLQLDPMHQSIAKTIHASSPLSNSNSIISAFDGGAMYGGFNKPPECYNQMINRFNEWFNTYRALKMASNDTINEAVDVIRDKMQDLDKDLAENHCKKQVGDFDFIGQMTSQIKDKVKNIDFVYKVFETLVGKLEAVLEITRNSSNLREITDEREEATDERTSETMLDLIRKNAIKEAKNWIQAEMRDIWGSLSYLSDEVQAKTNNVVLDVLAPIFEHIGGSNAKTAVNLLLNPDLREALFVLTQSNPLTFMRCLDDETDDDKC